MRKLYLLLLLLPALAWGQTYSLPPGKTFVCDAASRYPVTEFYQFSCRGIPLADNTGNVVGSFFLFRPSEIIVEFPMFVASPYRSYVTSYPLGNLPATYTFDWYAEDTNGVSHTGRATVTWHDYVICGGRGCIWHAPKLTAFTVTVQ